MVMLVAMVMEAVVEEVAEVVRHTLTQHKLQPLTEIQMVILRLVIKHIGIPIQGVVMDLLAIQVTMAMQIYIVAEMVLMVDLNLLLSMLMDQLNMRISLN